MIINRQKICNGLDTIEILFLLIVGARQLLLVEVTLLHVGIRAQHPSTLGLYHPLGLGFIVIFTHLAERTSVEKACLRYA